VAAFGAGRIPRWPIVHAAIATAGFLLSFGPLVRVGTVPRVMVRMTGCSIAPE
jgi:hypothetical protein